MMNFKIRNAILTAALVGWSGCAMAQGFFASAAPTQFWVGGSGNINDPGHCALKSGGPANNCVFNLTAALTIDGNSGTGTITINVATKLKTINLNTVNMTISDTVGAGITTSGTVNLSAGTIITNGATENWEAFASATTTTRALNIAGSSININQSVATPWSISSATGITVTTDGSTVINLNGFAAGFSDHTTTTYPNIVYVGCGPASVNALTSVVNLTMNCSRNSWLFDDTLAIPAAGFTVTNFTVSGSNGRNRVLIYNNNAQAPISAANTSFANVEFRNINATTPWSCVMCGDDGGNTGITFPASKTLFWVGNTGLWSDEHHWSLTSGGPPALLVPYAQDMGRFDQNSFTLPGQSVVMDYSQYSSWDWTGVTNMPNLAINAGGDLTGTTYTFSPNMTTSGGTPVGAGFLSTFNRMTYYRPGATATLTANGVTIAAGIGMSANGGTLQLGSDLNSVIPAGVSLSEGGLLMAAGTFNSNGHNVSMNGSVTSSGTLARAITMAGSETWTLSLGTGTIWAPGASAGFTLNPGTAKIKIAGTPTGPRTFAGSGLTYASLEWAGEGVTSSLIVTGANTFATFQVDPDTVGRTITFPPSVTQTAGTASLNGASGAVLTVNSSTPGTAGTLSATTVTASYLSLQDSTAAGAASPFTATHSTIVSNVTNWNASP